MPKLRTNLLHIFVNDKGYCVQKCAKDKNKNKQLYFIFKSVKVFSTVVVIILGNYRSVK